MSFRKVSLFLLLFIFALTLSSCVKDDKDDLSKISVDRDNMDDTYDVDNFVLSDIKLFLINKDWSSTSISLEQTMISTEDLELFNTPGDYEITVKYQGLETTFNITMRFKKEKQDLYELYKLAKPEFEISEFNNWYLDITDDDSLNIKRSYIDIWGKLYLELEDSEILDKGVIIKPVDREYDFRVNGKYIEWKYSTENYWIILIHKDALDLLFNEKVDLNNVEVRKELSNLEVSYGDTDFVAIAKLDNLLNDKEIKAYVGSDNKWYVGSYNTGINFTPVEDERIPTTNLNYSLVVIDEIEGYELTGYNGDSVNIVVDNTYNNKPVISIKSGSLPTNIKSLSISSNTVMLPFFNDYIDLESFDYNFAPIDQVVDSMFSGCNNLYEITNYENIINIGRRAFYNTQVLPSKFDFTNILNIGNEAFYNLYNYETSLGILFKITQDRYEIVSSQFICLPDTIKSVGSRAFLDFFPVYYKGSDDIILYHEALYKNIKELNGLWYIEKQDQSNNKYISIVNYIGDLAYLDIPEEINGIPVLEIERKAFNGNSTLERINLPSSIKIIGAYSFSGNVKLDIVGISSYVSNRIGLSLAEVLSHLKATQTELFLNSIKDSYNPVFVFSEYYSFDIKLSITRYFTNQDVNSFYYNDLFIYRVSNNKVNIVAIKNHEGVVVIPKEIDNLEVTSISSNALVGFNGGVTGIDIQANVVSIHYEAFNISTDDISLLEFINIPSSIKNLHSYFVSPTQGINIHIDLPSDNINLSSYRFDSLEEGYLNNVIWNSRYIYK